MAYVGKDWDPVDPTIKRPYTYDFSLRMPSDDTIASVDWELVVAPTDVYTADDPSPSSHISNEGSSGALASAWLDSLVENCRYKLTAFITTTAGIKDDLFAYIVCVPRP
jgi:hypothetical protein